MACGDFVGMYAGMDSVKVPVGPFVRKYFYSGKTLPECFDAFKHEYGGYGFEKGEEFNPLKAAAMIRGDWYHLKKSNHLSPGAEGVTLDALLDRPRTDCGVGSGRTGFAENPQFINRNGRPRKGKSLFECYDSV